MKKANCPGSPSSFRSRRLPCLATDETARLIAQSLLRRADAMPTDSLETWEQVAHGLNVRIVRFHAPGGNRAAYRPIYSDGATGGNLELNTAQSERAQIEAVVHELAHHYLCSWQPPLLEDWADNYSYSDSRKRVHHQIARKVEKRILRQVQAVSASLSTD